MGPKMDESAMAVLACVVWRFCRAGRTSGQAARLLPPQSPRGFSALARLYYLARPTKTAMLRRLWLSGLFSPLLFQTVSTTNYYYLVIILF